MWRVTTKMLTSVLIIIVCVLLGYPIYLGLLAGGIYLQLFVNQVPIEMVISGMYDAVAKTALLAVTFFILAGSFMNGSSMANRLVSSILPWVKNVRGGFPIAGVAANEIFGAMSGSSSAAVSTIGRVIFTPLKKSHGERFSLGLVASTGALSIIMPPSIAMILFAVATNSSVGSLFLAGIIPALIIGILLLIFVVWMSPPVKGLPAPDYRFAVRETVRGIPVLLLPFIILGGIYGGVFTPTEAGAVAVIYSIFLPSVIYREFDFAAYKKYLLEGLAIISKIFILVASSNVLSQALIMANVHHALIDFVGDMNPLMFLFSLNIFLLIVGSLFDTACAILVLAPIIAPIALNMNIDIIHLGIIFTINLAIGMFTPPYGLNLFIVQSVLKRPIERVSASVPPFFVVYVIALLIITYFPQLYLWLPRALLY